MFGRIRWFNEAVHADSGCDRLSHMPRSFSTLAIRGLVPAPNSLRFDTPEPLSRFEFLALFGSWLASPNKKAGLAHHFYSHDRGKSNAHRIYLELKKALLDVQFGDVVLPEVAASRRDSIFESVRVACCESRRDSPTNTNITGVFFMFGSTSHRTIQLLTLILLIDVVASAQQNTDVAKFPADINYRTANIISEGVSMSAELFSPKDVSKKLPTIVLSHGWGGTAESLRPDGVAFARAGFLVVTFDYRGWGNSDARLIAKNRPEWKDGKLVAEVTEVRGVIDPIDQTTDVLNALNWVYGYEQCDRERIGIWGSSFSGGHVVYVAARDPRVKAFVSQVGSMDARWVVTIPQLREHTFSQGNLRSSGKLGYPEPFKAFNNLRGEPVWEKLMQYAPIEDIVRCKDCAKLFIIAEKEELFDNKDHAILAYERATGVKKLVSIKDIKHYGIYNVARDQAQKEAIAWFNEHLKGKPPNKDAVGQLQTPNATAEADPAVVAKASAPLVTGNGDWAMYNCNSAGWRYNAHEKILGRDNVRQLELQWSFPAEGSNETVGVIHATPAVVGGEVYFGTATFPAFYKLGKDGALIWVYRNSSGPSQLPPSKGAPITEKLRRAASEGGIFSSALVEAGAVYFADTSGWIYCLDATTGKERWKVSSRDVSFPESHWNNVLMGSPIMADGKVIFTGGTLEQLFAGTKEYAGSTGRGFVIALDPANGQVQWKHDVGPKPEKLYPPVVVEGSWGKYRFEYGPATSSVWSTPSFDAESNTIYFGTDVNTAPRQPTTDNSSYSTEDSCAIVAIDASSGKRKWNTQINSGDMWTNAMRAYDPKTGRYKDAAVGDTPKIFTLDLDGKLTKVVGAGCKNGGFYILRVVDGKLVAHTPVYTGAPTHPTAEHDPRVLALPSPIGGLQSGCATDGHTIFTNGIDAIRLATQESPLAVGQVPTAGRVTATSIDLSREEWRHERPKIAAMGGTKDRPMYRNVGDIVGSGIALGNGVAYFTSVGSGKLLALNTSSGEVLKEIEIGPVFCGPSLSQGRVYVGGGNTLWNESEYECYFPKQYTGSLRCFGLPTRAPEKKQVLPAIKSK